MFVFKSTLIFSHFYFYFSMSASREDRRHPGLELGPGPVPAARLPEQQRHVKETGTMSGCPVSDPGSPPGLPRPLPVPVHFHLHTPAPAGPGCCAPVVSGVHRAGASK